MQPNDQVPIPQWMLDRWPGIGGDDKMQIGSAWVGSYGYSRATGENVKTLIAGQAAILAAVRGDDLEAITAAMRTELDRAAAEERAERQAERQALVEPLATALAPLINHDVSTAAVEAALRNVLGGLDTPGQG